MIANDDPVTVDDREMMVAVFLYLTELADPAMWLKGQSEERRRCVLFLDVLCTFTKWLSYIAEVFILFRQGKKTCQ